MSDGTGRCYGGPMHGRLMPAGRRRFESTDRTFPRPRLFSDAWEVFREPQIQTATYTVREYRQRCSVAHKSLRVAVVDDANLTHREEHELFREMASVPWDWPEPSIVKDFDQWWRWNLYTRHRNATERVHRQCRTFDEYGSWPDSLL